LLKETILDFGAGARRFISNRAKGNFTFHVCQGEEFALIGFDDMLIETGRGLGAKLITGINVLGWGTLTSHIGGCTIQHGVGAATTTVETTGLRIHKNFVVRFDWGNGSLVLNSGKARLKLIRHLLLHENIIYQTYPIAYPHFH
jgi:hypothetical protein